MYLKKWAPIILSRDFVLSPINSKSIVEVLVASMQCGGQYFSRSEKICCFKETFSITACFENTKIKFNHCPQPGGEKGETWQHYKREEAQKYLYHHVYIFKTFIVKNSLK